MAYEGKANVQAVALDNETVGITVQFNDQPRQGVVLSLENTRRLIVNLQSMVAAAEAGLGHVDGTA